jgi:hypothetical protein
LARFAALYLFGKTASLTPSPARNGKTMLAALPIATICHASITVMLLSIAKGYTKERTSVATEKIKVESTANNQFICAFIIMSDGFNPFSAIMQKYNAATETIMLPKILNCLLKFFVSVFLVNVIGISPPLLKIFLDIF